ncbi:MAG: hypothetical protein J3Q66DRAFT_345933 [Benniella sp.]|nr:MAG: hypothetical protein J3Q66DRAFT_345933 [Benniella sp.]
MSSTGTLTSPHSAAMSRLFLFVATRMSVSSLLSTINFDSFQSQAGKCSAMMATHAGNPRIPFRTYHPLSWRTWISN